MDPQEANAAIEELSELQARDPRRLRRAHAGGSERRGPADKVEAPWEKAKQGKAPAPPARRNACRGRRAGDELELPGGRCAAHVRRGAPAPARHPHRADAGLRAQDDGHSKGARGRRHPGGRRGRALIVNVCSAPKRPSTSAPRIDAAPRQRRQRGRGRERAGEHRRPRLRRQQGPASIAERYLTGAVLAECVNDATGAQRDFICQLALTYVEQKYKDAGPQASCAREVQGRPGGGAQYVRDSSKEAPSSSPRRRPATCTPRAKSRGADKWRGGLPRAPDARVHLEPQAPYMRAAALHVGGRRTAHRRTVARLVPLRARPARAARDLRGRRLPRDLCDLSAAARPRPIEAGSVRVGEGRRERVRRASASCPRREALVRPPASRRGAPPPWRSTGRRRAACGRGACPWTTDRLCGAADPGSKQARVARALRGAKEGRRRQGRRRRRRAGPGRSESSVRPARGGDGLAAAPALKKRPPRERPTPERDRRGARGGRCAPRPGRARPPRRRRLPRGPVPSRTTTRSITSLAKPVSV